VIPAPPGGDPRGAAGVAAGVHARSMLFTLFGDYVRHYGGTVWIGSLITLMGEMGFRDAAVRAAVSRMTRQGWLAAVRSGRASYYALTPRGEARIEEAARRIFKLDPERWDGLWRIVLVPSAAPTRREDRTALRRELEWMGFAGLARGVYVTPNDLLAQVPALVERYGLGQVCEVFAARLAGPEDAAAFAARHWDLPAIDAAYAAFAGEWRPRLAEWRAAARAGGVLDLPGGAAFREKTRLVHEFRKFLFVDPGLPADVLPERWNGAEARGIFSAAYHLLAEAALRFFEAHYRPAPGREGDVPEGRREARRNPFRTGAGAVPTAGA
jgi:phenylacetic acid degradation operon negative regulatory protein